MKVVFLSNYFNHHQAPLSDALWQETEGSYLFIESEVMPEERRALGCGAEARSYVISLKENRQQAIRAVLEADVVVAGSAAEWLVRRRVKSGKLLLRYSERPLKRGREGWKYLPRLLRWHWRNPADKPIYLLCAGGYTAQDYAKFGLFRGKCYRWGYFPEMISYDLPELMGKKDALSLLWCGRFVDWKHPEAAVLAVETLKKEGFPVHLTLIGRGETEEKLRKMTRELGLTEQVSFPGVLDAKGVRQAMEQAGIFLFTSGEQEGWGAVLNEAMNSGCAVVASADAGATPFLIADGENGLVYPGGDRDALAAKLRYLLENPREQRRLGTAAYRTVEGQWNARVAAKRLVALAQMLTEQTDSGPAFPDGPCSPVTGRKEKEK